MPDRRLLASGSLISSVMTTVSHPHKRLKGDWLTGKEGSTRAMAGGSSLMQSFSLPGECDKAAKILKSFLGASIATNDI